MRKPKGDCTDLFLAFRMLLDPRKLWLAFKGVLFSAALVAVLLALFACMHDLTMVPASAAQSEADVLGPLRAWRLGAAARATRAFVIGLLRDACADLRGIAATAGRPPLDRAVRLFASQALATLVALGALIAFVLLFVWSYYGAAIMRLAAVECATGDRIELRSATAYTRRKHQSFYGPPLGLAVAALAVGFLILLAGLLVWNALLILVALVGFVAVVVGASAVRDRLRSGPASLGFAALGAVVLVAILALIATMGWRIPYLGEVLVGVLIPLALLGGFVIAILCLWMVFGLPLMAGVVATSDVGAFEAWSRSFHYLFVHPWRYASYVLVAAAHGAVCMAFVHLVRVGTEWAAFAPLSVGTLLIGGQACEPLVTAFLVAARVLLSLVFLAFVAGYIFTSHAIIYLLLRRCADGTPITEVHLEPRDRERLVPPPAPPPEGPKSEIRNPKS